MIKDNKKTVFLTGATGLVGSYLLKLLLQEGCKVYVLAIINLSASGGNARDRDSFFETIRILYEDGINNFKEVRL